MWFFISCWEKKKKKIVFTGANNVKRGRAATDAAVHLLKPGQPLEISITPLRHTSLNRKKREKVR